MSKRIGIMTPYLFTEKRFNSWPKPVYGQPKVEGDRLRNINCARSLLSSYANERISLPHIKIELMQTGWAGIETDGEAYKHGLKHSEIRSIVSRTVNMHPQYPNIKYYIFDLIYDAPQKQRLHALKGMFRGRKFKHLIRVPSTPLYTLEDVQTFYDQCLLDRYEGAILRHPYGKYERQKSTYIMKLKPRVSEYFKIVQVYEEEDKYGNLKDTFGSFGLVTEEGNTFNCGSGPTKEQRKLFWTQRRKFPGMEAKIRFQNYTKVRKVPKLLSLDTEWLKTIEKILR